MATENQIHANRRNAQRSTGPRSVEGKAASSRNALKTGLYAAGIVIGHESCLQLQQLEAQFTAEYCPSTPTGRSLVDQLIHCEWMLRRYRWVETEVWKAAFKSRPTAQLEISPYGFSFIHEPAVSRLHRQRAALQRTFRETLAELRRVQTANRHGEPFELPDPAPQPIDSTATSPQIGFVPSSSVPAADAPQPSDSKTISPKIGFVPPFCTRLATTPAARSRRRGLIVHSDS